MGGAHCVIVAVFGIVVFWFLSLDVAVGLGALLRCGLMLLPHTGFLFPAANLAVSVRYVTAFRPDVVVLMEVELLLLILGRSGH